MPTPQRVMMIGLLVTVWLLFGACGSGSDSPVVTTSGGGPAGASVTLTWDPVNDRPVKGYNVYHGTASGTYQPPLDAALNTTHTISNLQSGTRYFLAVTAYNSAGESGYSNEVSASTP